MYSLITDHPEWGVALAIVVGGLLVLGGGDLLRLSPKRIWAISTVCFRQSIRRRVLWITPLVMIGVVIVSQFQRGDAQDAIRQTTSFCLFATGMLLILVTIVLASTNLPKEIENRVIYTIATKPTTRLEIVLGKVLGFAHVSFWTLLIMGVFSLAFLHFRQWRLGSAIAADLDTPGAVDQVSRPTLEYYRKAGLLHARELGLPANMDLMAHRPKGPDDWWVPGAGGGIIVAPFKISRSQIPPDAEVEVEIDVRAKRIAAAATSPTTAPAGQPMVPFVAIDLRDQDGATVATSHEVAQPQPIGLGETGGVVRRKIEPEYLQRWIPTGADDAQLYVALIAGSLQHEYRLGPGGFSLIVGGNTRIRPFAPPMLSGRPGRYGQQLKGQKSGEGRVALYRFRNQDVSLSQASFTFEMRVGLEPDRAEENLDESATSRILLTFENPTNHKVHTAEVFPENNRPSYIDVPAALLEGGGVDVWMRMASDGWVGLRPAPSASLALVVSDQSFAFNLFKSLSVLWMLSVLVTIIAICCSTFLSWPIAIVLTAMLLIGRWTMEQVAMTGAGRWAATEYLDPDSTGAKWRTVEKSVDALVTVMSTAASVMPDISKYAAVAELESGMAVSPATLLGAVQVTTLFGLPMLVLAYVFLKYKEVAPLARGRGFISATLLLSFVATFGMQTLARQQRERLVPRSPTQSRLNGLDSFTLGLVLGGLRGPLVMITWPSIENQKTARDLDAIDTKINLLRMLQAEFDSVHVFQMWNKAWNISVQLASRQNRYAMILEALDYGTDVLKDRPDNVNIFASMARIYYFKLGTDEEYRYYTSRLREDTMARPRPPLRNQRRMRHDVLLDERGMILPQYLKPEPGMPEGRDTIEGYVYNGADLQFLGRYNTAEAGGFPYGISTFALAYDYYKRAQVLTSTTSQKCVDMSDNMLSVSAARAMRAWAEEELTIARRCEIEAFGKPVPFERIAMEEVTASAAADARFADASEQTRARVAQSIFGYDRAVTVGNDSVLEYARHMNNPQFALSSGVYMEHADNARAIVSMAAADRDYLKAVAARAGFTPPLEKPQDVAQLLRSAAVLYQQAIDRYYIMILKYNTDAELASRIFPVVTRRELKKPFERDQIQHADPKVYPKLREALKEEMRRTNFPDYHEQDIHEFELYIQRAQARLDQLKALQLTTAP